MTLQPARTLLLPLIMASAMMGNAQLPVEGLISEYSFTLGNTTDTLTGITLAGSVPYLTTDRFGVPGNAYYFPGGDMSHFDAGDTYDGLISGDAATFSMSFWLWIEDEGVNNIRQIFAKRADDGNCGEDQRQFYIGLTGDEHLMTVINGALGSPNQGLYEEDTVHTLLDSTWYHVIYTYDLPQGHRRFHVGCEAVPATLIQQYGSGLMNGIVPGAAHWGIGSALSTTGTNCSDDGEFRGKLDDIRYYDRVLTEQQLDSLCQGGLIGLEPTDGPAPLTITPNPTTGSVNVRHEGLKSAEFIVLWNGLGQPILTIPLNGNHRQTIDLSAYTDGVYFLEVRYADGTRAVERIVKR